MADNFSANQVQGVFGEFKPVADETVEFSTNNVQGIFGLFVFVLDEAAGVVVADLTVWYEASGFNHWYKTIFRETSSTGDSRIS